MKVAAMASTVFKPKPIETAEGCDPRASGSFGQLGHFPEQAKDPLIQDMMIFLVKNFKQDVVLDLPMRVWTFDCGTLPRHFSFLSSSLIHSRTSLIAIALEHIPIRFSFDT
jgi:hypothetical protein